jgi:hypothetical protein
MKTKGLLFLFLLSLVSCISNEDRLKVDLSGISITPVVIGRYDLDLFKIPLNDLQDGLKAIQGRYMFFLGTDLDDTTKLAPLRAYLTSPRTIEFQQVAAAKYPTLTRIEVELTEAFKHYKYYFPHTLTPSVYSYISGGDYENPVRLADSVLIIGLDNYLGADFKPYKTDGISLYKAQRMTAEYIVPDCIMTLANVLCPVNTAANTLLDQMVDAGKRLYIADAFLPKTAAWLKIGYDQQKANWVIENESHVWAAIVQNNMLYSSNSQSVRTFFADGPNTPAFGPESPPRLGEWMGWMIVKAYMNENPDVTLPQLIAEQDAQKILTKSGYKPKKK